MIFAKLDVTLTRHHRLLRIPKGARRASALGVYAAAIMYSREHELDGWLPLDAIDGVATPQALKDLVDVGLVERDDGDGPGEGLRVLRYDAKNETRAVIDARREATRKRVTDFRRNARGNALHPPLPTSDVTGAVPGSGSPSVCLSGSGESSRGGPALADPTVAEFDLDALERGIAVATGAPCHFDRRFREVSAWAEIFARCSPAEGTDRGEFLRGEGTRFGAWCRAKGVAPNRLKFNDWLNLGAPGAEDVPRRRAVGGGS